MSGAEDLAGVSGNAKKPFLCGVCEGFYGKPWTTNQRRELFHRMNRFEMTTYLYAPKDDYLHRLYWRRLYSQEESDDLRELIAAAKENNVTFVYALSPGLDIRYSSDQENDLLQQKLDQVKSFGCESFALLFDDIETELQEEDGAVYPSMAHAQCDVTNKAYKHLANPDVFLFCPTEYCATRASPDLVKSEYLKTLGEELAPGVDIMWTGPKVVSRSILLSGILEVCKIIKRPPVIWDNIHANDYDQTRMFLGPYEGRPPELCAALRGVLTNPNCEFEANFVAMHTLAQWSKNCTRCYPVLNNSESDMDTDPGHLSTTKYNPRMALQRALEDWLPEFYKTKACSSVHAKKLTAASKDSKNDSTTDIAMETETTDTAPHKKNSKKEKTIKTDKSPKSNTTDCSKDKLADILKTIRDKKKMDELEPLILSDLMLICDFFYLPYEYGARAIHMLKQGHWLVANADRVKDAQKIPKSDHTLEIREWYDRAIHFHECHKDLCMAVDKFVNMKNRELLYELYTYVGDIRNCLTLVNSYIKWHGMGKPDKEPFRRSEQEPWVHRGGIYSEFRRLLPLEGQNDMFPSPGMLKSGHRVFTIRPFYPDDKMDVFTVCRQTCDDGLDGSDIFPDHPHLVADQCIGCLLEHFPRHSYVLEDDAGVCGYVTAAPDVRDYQKVLKESWLPKMKEKYAAGNNGTESKEDENSKKICPAQLMICTFHENPPPIPNVILEQFPAFLQIQTMMSRVEGLTTPTRLLNACLQGLKSLGVKGVHTVINCNQLYVLTFLYQLGFVDVSNKKKQSVDEMLILGRPM